MSNQIVHVTDATFEAEVLQSSQPVLLDFWAPWCGPCKMIAPILDQLADEWAGKIKIAKMNVDDNQAIPAQFGIRSIPTLVVLKDGQVLATRPGALAKPQLEAFVNASLAG
ncbi:thioredoxin TrxA [Kingella kingae]|uniref:Thioredoxin n=2 Tax=Kingella kingae TaxID=504 RepID=F5S6U6_KINKI|nr:thioredoxin TrxA [Kingella kingae]EGK09265.1 thioredoxin [Kingella kingae ATCC 23330]EIC13737.1 thioredoxin [Kingella kingae PYKK081]MBD3613010.1 thioredoxin TrxA [Kingella kingae]MBD3631368.1 thioredoxin TrxA [Kingella kingae]MBD3658676.1 thioredoxin TrxA [Kingella kingae]